MRARLHFEMEYLHLARLSNGLVGLAMPSVNTGRGFAEEARLQACINVCTASAIECFLLLLLLAVWVQTPDCHLSSRASHRDFEARLRVLFSIVFFALRYYHFMLSLYADL